MSLNELKIITEDFFKTYINSEISIPKWSKIWDFNSEIPNNGKKGCYALLDENDKILYIGVAVSKGQGIESSTPGGLGARCKIYRIKINDLYEPNIKSVKGLITIGFEENIYFIAKALEEYLINRISPELNTLGKNNKI